jgi:hypothetical protein
MSNRRKYTRRSNHKQQDALKQQRQIATGLLIVILLAVGFLTYEFALKKDFEPEVTGAPAARVANTVVDHGHMRVGEFVTTEFEVTNVGDELLIFYGQPFAEVIEGCCPPTVEMDKRELRPGETAKVTMRYTMHEGMDGPHEFRIELNTNDPASPEIVLSAFSDWV